MSSWLYNDCDDSKVLFEIKRSELEVNNEKDCSSLNNFQVIGTYNWLPESKPTKPIIVIPGKSGFLAKKKCPLQQLKLIKYLYISDENKHCYPDYPIEPIYRSVLQCTPDFNFKEVDVITDRHMLRTLLGFLEDREQETMGFRIDFKRVGNSIALFRYDKEKTKYYDDYSQDFEAKITTNNRSFFKKIVSYDLGTLKLVVRFEADYAENIQKEEQSDSVNDLISSISAFDINNNDLTRNFEGSNLSYIKYGTLLKEQKTIELATKSTYKKPQFPESKWDLLFFAKGEYLVFGWHFKGMLEKIEKIQFSEITKRCNRTKESIHASMSRLIDLLTKLNIFALSQIDDGATYSAIYDRVTEIDSIKVYKCIEGINILPKDFLNKIY